MASFVQWLKTTQHTDPGVQKLAEKARTEHWDDSLSREDTIRLINSSPTLSNDEKVRLTSSLIDIKADSSGETKTWWQNVLDFLGSNAQMFVVFVLAFAILGSLIFVIVSATFRQNLAEIEISRGIITFFFGLGTVGVALILVTAAFTSERDKDDIKERFDMGKQVLTTLIGIFGTIVGFYFGTEVSNRPPPPDTAQVEAASAPTATSEDATASPEETQTQGEAGPPAEQPQ